MASLADPWVLFNRKLEEFANDLASTFPEVNEFVMLKNSLRLAFMMTPKLPQAIFNQRVAIPYETHIVNKDEGFFLAENYTQTLEDTGVTNLDIVAQIKHIWTTLSPTHKETIWKYFQVLIVLNRKCQ